MSNALISNQKERVRELLDSSTDIGIIIGENQNIDTVAAGLAFYLILQSRGKNVQVVSKKEPIVEVSSLVGVDRISKSFGGKTSVLTISVPYREGEIEKVSYNIEDTKLNVNLFAEESGITFDERDVQYIRKGASPSLVITIGVGSEEELSGLVDLKSVKTIHLDRNPLNALMGDVSIIDPSFSSLSEIVTQLIIELNLGYDVDAFQNLTDGITYSTRNFTSQTTSPYAFEAVGFLLQNGAKRKERNQNMRPFDSAQGKRDDRNRNFPREDQFLRGSQPQQRTQGANPMQNNNPQPQQPRIQILQQPKIQSQFPSQHGPKEMTTEARDLPEETPYTEGSRSSEVPDDWFLPKVFKGSKKGN